MKAYQMSKQSKLSIEEKKNLLQEYDISDLLYALREVESNPGDFDKEIIIEIHNKLFEKGITCI